MTTQHSTSPGGYTIEKYVQAIQEDKTYGAKHLVFDSASHILRAQRRCSMKKIIDLTIYAILFAALAFVLTFMVMHSIAIDSSYDAAPHKRPPVVRGN